MSRIQWNSTAIPALPRLGCPLLVCLIIALPLPAQTLAEYDVEAVCLHDSGKFVSWPADAWNSSFAVSVTGKQRSEEMR